MISDEEWSTRRDALAKAVGGVTMAEAAEGMQRLAEAFREHTRSITAVTTDPAADRPAGSA